MREKKCGKDRNWDTSSRQERKGEVTGYELGNGRKGFMQETLWEVKKLRDVPEGTRAGDQVGREIKC